jgi:hypothetical protein
MPTLNEPGSALFADLDGLSDDEIMGLIGKLRVTRLSDIERTKKAVVRQAMEDRPKKKVDKTGQIKQILQKVGFEKKILDLMSPKQLVELAKNVASRQEAK